MKLKYILLATICIATLNVRLGTLNCYAQAPQAFKYQSIIRNAAGNPMASANVTVRATVHDGSAAGTVVYQETHAATTNQFGLINLSIGSGTVISGNFSTINWGSGSKWIEIEADFGAGYLPMGTSQLLSVPYALYSGNGGTPGATGTTGAAGMNGMTGPTGAMGITGTQGPTGNAGANGMTGPTGAMGLMGMTGTTGLNGDKYASTSSTSLTIAMGAQSLTIGTGLAYTVAQQILIAFDASNVLTATITSYNSGTGALNVNVTSFIGAGTYAAWSINMNGAPGPQGIQGATGSTGAASVVPGPTGPTGNTGSQGATGSMGTTGLAGATGSQGATGAQGVTGPQGAAGTQGTTGAAGTTGAMGATGTQGITGSQGAAGTQGTTGAVGATGAMGTTGAQGVTGSQGATGTQGTTGALGATGAMGTTGAQGLTGSQGATGTQGTTGAVGTTGAMGTTGAQGVTGSQGTTGIQGTTGAAGVTGSIGTTGAKGATGSTGAQGIQGMTGPSGSLNAWGLNGTTPVISNFLGTTDFTSLRIRTNNVERALFDSLGNVGIGGKSLGFGLQLNREGVNSIVGAVSYGAGFVPSFACISAQGTLAAPTASQQDDMIGLFSGRGYGTTAFSNGSKGAYGVFASQPWTDANQGAYLVLFTTPDNSTTRTEVVRITSNGSMGIGTNNPQRLLHVTDLNNNPQARFGTGVRSDIEIEGHTTAGIASWIGMQNDGAGANKVWIGSGAFPNKLFIAADGKVSMGTSSPGYNFHLKGAADPLEMMVENSGGAFKTGYGIKTATQEWFIGKSSAASNGLAFKDMTLALDRMIIETNGNVAIGTVGAAASKLDVNGTITISGANTNELNRAQTGTANMVPIAYGEINSGGGPQSSTGNISVAKSSTGVYTITITGETYTQAGYITIATIVDNNPGMIITKAVVNNLVIKIGRAHV